VSGKMTTKENFHFNADWSYARNNWGNAGVSDNTKVSPDNSAVELTLEKSFLADRAILELGYFYVGAAYYTSANPFLWSNQQGFIAKLDGTIGQKLTLASEVKIGQTIDESISSGQQKNIQLLGSFSWRPASKITINGQIAPNTFKYFGTGQVSVANENMLYNLQVSTQHQIKQAALLNTAGFTNNRTQLAYSDTMTLNKTKYLFLQQLLSLPSALNFSMYTMGGKVSNETAEADYTFLSQFNIGIQKQKWNSTLGVQLLKDAFLPDWYYGLTSYQEVKLGQEVSILLDISWQVPKSKDSQASNRFWGSLSISKLF